jgi:hypothetical protein
VATRYPAESPLTPKSGAVVPFVTVADNGTGDTMMRIE